MNHLYTFLALDLANERAREAAEFRRASSVTADGRPNIVRRGLAASLAVVSRASAGAARRLDRVAVEEHDARLAAAR